MVVNTCAFIEEARQESIEMVLDLDRRRRAGARLVVTGCMAERYGDELAARCPRWTWSPGSAIALVRAAHCRGARPAGGAEHRSRLRPAGAAASRRRFCLGLPEGGRGVRPGLRVLRDPELPGPPALAGARRPRRRGGGPGGRGGGGSKRS